MFIVRAWERAVRARGAGASLVEPGIHLRIPFIDSIEVMNNRLRIGAFPIQTIATADHKVLGVGGLVGFRIVDPLAAVMAMQQPEMSCAAFVQSFVAAYLTRRTFDEISLDELEEIAKEQLQLVVAGIEVEFVQVTDFAPVRAIRLLQESWRPETRPD